MPNAMSVVNRSVAAVLGAGAVLIGVAATAGADTAPGCTAHDIEIGRAHV